MSRKRKNPDDFVPRSFCDERTRRIEQKIDSMKTDIINALNKKANPPMPWQAKATILASFVAAATAVIVAIVA